MKEHDSCPLSFGAAFLAVILAFVIISDHLTPEKAQRIGEVLSHYNGLGLTQ